jgi:hypothetical protein
MLRLVVATGCLTLAVSLFAINGTANYQLPWMVLLAATAGLSSLAAP